MDGKRLSLLTLLMNSYTNSHPVYEQIEQLSQAPKPRRSKSFSRNDKNISRTSSTNHDHSSGKDSPPGNNRLSSDGMPSGSNRSSFDRAKSMKKLINGRSSSSNEGASNGHKRSESALSDETKQNWVAHGPFDPEVRLRHLLLTRSAQSAL